MNNTVGALYLTVLKDKVSIVANRRHENMIFVTVNRSWTNAKSFVFIFSPGHSWIKLEKRFV